MIRVPDDLQAILAVSDLGIVDSNHPAILGESEDICLLPCRKRSSETRAFTLAGQIGIDALLENGRNIPSPFSVRISQAAEYVWILNNYLRYARASAR